MTFENKSLEETYKELSRVERERDAKGEKHPNYPHACAMVLAIKKAITEKDA